MKKNFILLCSLLASFTLQSTKINAQPVTNDLHNYRLPKTAIGARHELRYLHRGTSIRSVIGI